ncbi:glycoprotein 3-alpha-L-fucosyltransferase A-like [Actinia tenebrosa]|uniref:Fucosyltransferase n=1 Tax=Actinia tenebrosa TaxID=6105 RepID=A0A6P8ISG3_ACTTE|nr:glycoprotein 3-alpha-L-fucosyltransferase A-like [Actinia tenebrosa]
MKRTITKVILLLYCLAMAFILWNELDDHPAKVALKYLRTNEKTKLKDQKQEPVILLYTDFFTGPWYLRWDKHYPCRFNCKFTYNKSVLDTANAVGFHDADLPLVLPKRTKSDQIWFYFNLESPVNSKTGDYRNIFNWTMSYRTDSDVFTPYGIHEPLSCSEALAFKNEAKHRNFAAKRTKMIAWISSNCDDSIGRYDYVQKLTRYVNVDIYGQCGNLSCKRGSNSRLSNDCKKKISKYKFYLAFENSLCQDYISEKYWENALENELIPVVMGGADYDSIAIPDSFINVEDFETVKNLADYLKYLDQNDTAYNEYFQWKNMFKLSTPYTYGCALCTALNSRKAKQPKVYSSLLDFWKVNKCRKNIKMK